MNLKQIDAALAVYDTKLDETEKARLAFFRKVWEVQAALAKEENRAVESLPDAADLQAWVRAEKPILSQVPASVEAEALGQAAQKIADCLVEYGEFSDSLSEALRRTNWERIAAAGNNVLAGSDPSAYVEASVDLLIDDGMTEDEAITGAQVFSLALRALIGGHAQTISRALVTTEAVEMHSLHCPLCGCAAGVARVGDTTETQGRGKELWCPQCGTTWEYERVRCARCGTQNQAHLHFFNIEGDDAHRLATCDECGGYVRTVYQSDTLAPFSFEVEDVVMAKLDMIAYQQTEAKSMTTHAGFGLGTTGAQAD
ncbi:MAG: formate dehydrogenase accessory protein FdhE [Gordonibacter sp.]|nr:formate dehydrogenase accessory protein FdhE [Gordonibacter sp.]